MSMQHLSLVLDFISGIRSSTMHVPLLDSADGREHDGLPKQCSLVWFLDSPARSRAYSSRYGIVRANVLESRVDSRRVSVGVLRIHTTESLVRVSGVGLHHHLHRRRRHVASPTTTKREPVRLHTTGFFYRIARLVVQQRAFVGTMSVGVSEL